MNAQALRLAGLIGILTVAALRAGVPIVPQVWFDVDPALDAMPLLALGSAGSHGLDLVLLAASTIALVGEVRSGRVLRVGLVFLALFPALVIAMYSNTGVESVHGFRGHTWLVAMVAFVALAHLVRERRLRVIALSVFVSFMVLLAVRGAVQVLVEHPATVHLYEETREAFLAERGWAVDSSAARTYERRLMQAEATGWFGLSNPFSTMMGVGAVALGALAILARRTQQSGNTLAAWLGCFACAALLVINGGKGAIAATLLAVAALVFALRSSRAPSGRWILVSCVAVIGAVGARWVVGSRLGELSLLLRGYYFDAAWTMLSEPSALLTGVGPDGVQELFNAAKAPECPEDVKSLHNIFVDWLATLGGSALAWIALITCALWRPIVDEPTPTVNGESLESTRADRIALWTALVIGVLTLLLQARVEAPTVDLFWFVTRILGVVAMAGTAVVVAQAAQTISARALGAVAFACALLVLVHAQIETVAWMPSSCVLALGLVAVGSSVSEGSRARRSVALWVLAVPLGLLAAGSMTLSWMGDRSREDRLDTVARLLTPLALERAANPMPDAAKIAREVELRLTAVRMLSQTDWSWSRATADAAVRQALTVVVLAPNRAEEALALATELASRRQLLSARTDALRADVEMVRLRHAAGGVKEIRKAVEVIERAALKFPNSPRRWIDLAVAREILRREALGVRPGGWRVEDGDPVADYTRALEVNARMSLDPLAQLSTREVQFVEAAILRLRELSPTGSP